jgi:hypothetical protein
MLSFRSPHQAIGTVIMGLSIQPMLRETYLKIARHHFGGGRVAGAKCKAMRQIVKNPLGVAQMSTGL